jgi:hypothetical protein
VIAYIFPLELHRFGPNRVKNPSFEHWDAQRGAPEHWIIGSQCQITRDSSEKHSGSSSVRLKRKFKVMTACTLYQGFVCVIAIE